MESSKPGPDLFTASDVSEDGTKKMVDPFQAEQQQFYHVRVITICANWFDEEGQDFKKIIQRLAREAAYMEMMV